MGDKYSVRDISYGHAVLRGDYIWLTSGVEKIVNI